MVITNEGDISVPFVGRPVVMEIDQKIFPIAGESVPLEVGQREREGVVDADDGWNVVAKAVAEPFG